MLSLLHSCGSESGRNAGWKRWMLRSHKERTRKHGLFWMCVHAGGIWGFLQGWRWLFFILMHPEMPCPFCIPFQWCVSRACALLVENKNHVSQTSLDVAAQRWAPLLGAWPGVIQTLVHTKGQDGPTAASSSSPAPMLAVPPRCL